MVGSGQIFFGANGINSQVDRRFVCQAQLIHIVFAHRNGRLMLAHSPVNWMARI
jgi:hypothetical protein